MSKGIRERGGKFQVRKVIAGKLFVETFTVKLNAELFVRKLELERDLGKLDMSPRGPGLSIETAGELYFAEVKTRLAENTVDSYRYRWDAFILPRFGPRPVKSVSTSDLEAFLSERLRGGVQPVTVDHDRILLSSFFSWATRRDLVPKNPMSRISKLKFSPLRARRALSESEVAACLEALEPPSRLAFLLAVYTGARASELCRLQWLDVDLSRSRLEIRSLGRDHTKTHKPRPIPLHPLLLEALREAPRRGKFVLPGKRGGQRGRDLRSIIDHACEVTKLESFRWHDLRHTFATWLRRNGTSLEDIGALLGHSDPRSTLIYAHETLDDLAAAICRLPSGAPPEPVVQPEPKTTQAAGKAKRPRAPRPPAGDRRQPPGRPRARGRGAVTRSSSSSS